LKALSQRLQVTQAPVLRAASFWARCSPNAFTSRPQPYDEDRAVVVDRRAVVRTAPTIGRRLLCDCHGNYFKKIYNERDDEVLVALDPADCEW
jgi:hypothetical protein